MNTNYNKYPKGSEWRKWDLHVHTKDTQKNDLFVSETFDDFCVCMFRKALENNISAIGITDYFNIKNYKKVKIFVDEADLNKFFNNEEKSKIKDIFIFPNIELRMLPSTNSEQLINIHCLLNPDTDFLDNLENNFFGSLEDSGGNKMNENGLVRLGKENNRDLDDKDAYKKGIENFVLEPSKLMDLFKRKPYLKENIIIAVNNSSNDGASGLQKHYTLFENETGSLDEVRRNIYKLSDAIFSGNPQDREFFLGKKEGSGKKKVISNCGSLKPCIHGSDAHCEKKLFNPDMSRYCWIKADLTFEGLKQIIYEPEDRVKIQANKPEEKSGYQVIESIEINNNICKQKIPLNQNLNTIVGGRSTGKSTLLQLIAHNVDHKIETNNFIIEIPQNSVKIKWQDKEENADRDIEYFSQNYMHDIAENNEKKNMVIEKIIAEKDDNKLLKNYKIFCRSNKITIQNNIDNLFELENKLNNLTTNLKEKGDKSGVEKEIENIQEKIKRIDKGDGFSEENLEKFKKIKNDTLEKEQFVKQSSKDKDKIKKLKKQEIFDQSFAYNFNDLSEENRNYVNNIFKDIQKMVMKLWKEKLDEKLEKITLDITNSTQRIENNRKDIIFQKGYANIESNKQYKELEERLKKEIDKLTEITNIKKQIDVLSKQKEQLFTKTINDHLAYFDEVNKLIEKFSLQHDDIQIKIKKQFMKNKCASLLKDFVNLKSHARQDFIKEWVDEYEENIKTKTEFFLERALEGKIGLKMYKDIKDLTKGLLTENWFSVSYELTYQNDTFEKMSDGKKSFVILKLLLEFSDKQCPILIDQPEDSLDNRAIYNELVTYIKQKKKDRQIILVTHNANIVLNADAEEVIVANQHGDDSKNDNDIKFQYVSGSLENTRLKNNNEIILKSQGIREHVCEILEGGTEAFKKREEKYGIQ